MKASIKRIMWFFGFWLVNTLDDLLFYITHNNPVDYTPTMAMLVLGGWFIPLFFFKDDKK